MSGAGRRSVYRKHLTNSILEGYPEPEEGEIVGRVVGSRGGNIIEIEIAREVDIQSSDGGDVFSGEEDVLYTAHESSNDDVKSSSNITTPTTTSINMGVSKISLSTPPILNSSLAILPTKFNKLVWVKRGDYVIAQGGFNENRVGNDGGGGKFGGGIGMVDGNKGSKKGDTTEGVGSKVQNNKKNDGDDTNDVNISVENVRKKSSGPGSSSFQKTKKPTTNQDTKAGGHKVNWIIKHILRDEQCKHLKVKGLWPMVFTDYDNEGRDEKGGGGKGEDGGKDYDGIVFTHGLDSTYSGVYENSEGPDLTEGDYFSEEFREEEEGGGMCWGRNVNKNKQYSAESDSDDTDDE
ncbi:hypothetical protein TrCOL_g5089 [Triparma columacea]|uniref:RNA-binding protein EIF1AD n=1 Tax=Triparma columacea TaxID=722753 RepID=A0A9W7L9U7_9STRA|nr:hypothetical protein TrCOL_g5089 [Triparma columacea]